MDIELLSKMVKELVLDNDRVVLPGLGAFVAGIVPASFSDRGYTINPPYRRLSFVSSDKEPDGLLAGFYAGKNNIPGDVAEQIVTEFAARMGEALTQQRMLVLPGLGKLRTARDGDVFFIPDEDLDIFPAGLGLEPISLKSHSKPKALDFSEFDLAPKATEPEPEPVAEPEPAAEPETTEPVSEPAPAEVEPEPIPEPLPEPAIEAEPEPEEPVSEPEPVQEPVQLILQEPEQEFVDPEEPETQPEPATTEVKAPVATEEKAPAAPEMKAPESGDGKKKGKGGKAFLITLLVIIGLAVLAAAALYLLSIYAPDILDRILYSKEELEIINYKC